MFEKELQTYLKAASSALPCAEARAAFEGYVQQIGWYIYNPQGDKGKRFL